MFVEEFLQIRIAIIGGGAEHVAEVGVRIGDEDRKEGLAVEVDEQRLVVGDEFGAKRQHEQREKNP